MYCFFMFCFFTRSFTVIKHNMQLSWGKILYFRTCLPWASASRYFGIQKLLLIQKIHYYTEIGVLILCSEKHPLEKLNIYYCFDMHINHLLMQGVNMSPTVSIQNYSVLFIFLNCQLMRTWPCDKCLTFICSVRLWPVIT